MIPRRLFRAVDFLAVVFAFCFAYAIWPELHVHLVDRSSFGWLPASVRPELVTGALPPFHSVAWMIVVGGLMVAFAFEAMGGYEMLLVQSRTRVVLTSIVAPIAAGSMVTLVLFVQKTADFSRLFLVTFIVIAAVSLIIERAALRYYLARRRDAGFYRKTVLIIGPRSVVDWLCTFFTENVESTEYRLAGYLGIPKDETDDDPPVPLIGQVGQLGEILISRNVDEVLAVHPNGGADWMPDVIEKCDSLGILLRIVPQGLLFGKMRILRNLYPFQLLHLPAIVLAPAYFDPDKLFVKRVLDIAIAATLLLLLSPLFAIIAIAIKLSDPKADVFYRWNVVGRNGIRFTGYKFTTMCADADDRKKELMAHNEMSGPVFKIRNDPRVTRIGRFLRKYSLNELPQLWSVLKGDMSLVGPRPVFPHELEGYGFLQKRKLSIRPGITCLWQVRGRNKIANFDDWVKMDLEYIDNWSLWLDFKILVRTAWAVVAGTGS